MYLISIYFDEKTNKKIQRYINQVAEKTGNQFMLDGNVPPHITISAFETQKEETIIESLRYVVEGLQRGKITFASVGQFFPYVIYLQPVLNKYLHEIESRVYDVLQEKEDIIVSPYYQPFKWLPHATIGKKLSKEEMQEAFKVLQNSFEVFEGEVVRIGLAKPNPHRDIAVFSFGDRGMFEKGHH